MAKHWSKLLLSLSATTLLLAGCKKNTLSTDTPLPPTYYPSVFINSDNQVLTAFNPADGSRNWQLSFAYLPQIPNTHYTPSPVYYNGSLYIACVNSDTLYKVDARTGVITQKMHDNGNYRSIATPLVDGKFLYICGLNGTVSALDTQGNHMWTFNAGSPLESSPVVYKNQIYIATTGGHVFSIDKTIGPDPVTGPKWDYPGAGVTVPFPASFVSSVTIGDPYVYVGSISDSSMYCIYIDPPVFPAPAPPPTPYLGYLRWTYKTKGAIFSSPAAYGGYCIFGSTDYNLYCLDTSIQPLDPIAPTYVPREVWKTRTESQIYSSPLAQGNVIYVGSNDQNLYAVNMINGSVKWTCNTSGLIKSSPALYGDKVFVGSYDKKLYAVDTANGSVKWAININGTIQCSPVIDNFNKSTGFNSQISGLTN